MSAPQLTQFAPGTPVTSISADAMNTMMQTCDNFTQLRAFVGVPGLAVFARGAVTIADGQQGIFGWVTGAAVDDGVNTIVPPAAFKGSWKRLTTVSPAGATYLNTVNNLSDVPNKSVAVSNLFTGLPAFQIGQFVATQSIAASNTTGAYAYGTLTFGDTNEFESFQTSVNSYAQNIVQNSSAGTAASSDYIVANNLTTATTYYGDFGINSSGFTGSGSLNLPNAVFLTATSGDLVLGTTTSNGIHFVVNNGATDALSIASSGVPTIAFPASPSSSAAYANAGNTTPVAGSSAAVSYKWESSTFSAESEGGIWTPNVYFNWVFNKEFNSGNTSGTNAPAVSLAVLAQNNGTTKDVVALLVDTIGRSANVGNFAANFIARNGGYNGAKLVGLEIDIEPDVGTTVGAGGGGLFINAFNVAMNYPAIQTGGVGGGTFINGIALYGLSTSAAGIFVGGNADSLVNTTVGTFTSAGVLLGNGKSPGIRLSGTAATHSYLYNDNANNVRAVLGSGSWIFRNSTDTVSLVAVSPSGNIDLTGGNGTLFFASAQSATTASAGAQALPANPVGFLQVQIGGTTRKIPYYAT